MYVGQTVFVVFIFGIFPSLNISLGTNAAVDLEFISTDVKENNTQLKTFDFITKTTDLDITKRPRRPKTIQRRKKIRGKNRKAQRTEIDSNSTLPSVGPRIRKNRFNSTSVRNHIARRRKFRNRRKRPKSPGTILELTTAKGIIFSRRNQTNETINKLIEKLNKNPEDNFDEFKSKKRTDKMIPTSENDPIGKNKDDIENITELIRINNGTEKTTSSLYSQVKPFNRCRKNRGNCEHKCHPKGKIRCSCLKGFYLGNDQRSCHDINECQFNNGQCETECVNLIGSYMCKCPEGLALTDDKLSCQDVNECLLRNGHGPCQDTCTNTFGSYECSCETLNGTVLGVDRYTCEDVDECLINNGGCSHICINTFGTSFCSCPSGMELSSDWKTCQDINECESEEITSACQNCINTPGSYKCLDVSDMQNDQSSTDIVCKPLYPPPRGFITCTRKGAFQSLSKKGRKRTINSPGTICELVCPVGYRKLGEYSIFCGVNGEWEGNTAGKCVAAAPPTLQCPQNEHATLLNDAKKILVKFPSPLTDVNWRYVKSKPKWAKDLRGNLTEGQHDVTFTVKDPKTRLFSTCSFKIFVKRNNK